MIRVSVQVTRNAFAPALKKIDTAIAALPAQALSQFQALTPRDTGNARRNTRLVNKREIIGDYPYAQRLEDNWSKQTKGQGIIKPFTTWWIAQLKRIARIR
jgi:hypothetical protein